MMKKIVLVLGLMISSIFAGNYFVNAQSANYNVKWNAVNISKDNVNAVINGVRPGDVVRYEVILSGGDGPGTYNPRVDVADVLNKAEMVNMGGGSLEGTDLVFPQKLCAGCEEQVFSFFVRAKDVCGQATAMTASINNVRVVVPFECELAQSGPSLLLALSVGLILIIMGYFIISLKRCDIK